MAVGRRDVQVVLAVNKTRAAEMLGVSDDFFDDHIAHELRCVRRGRRRLYPTKELEAWLDRSAERVSYPSAGGNGMGRG